MHNKEQNSSLYKTKSTKDRVKNFLRKIPSIFKLFKYFYTNLNHFISRFRWQKISERDQIMLNLGSGPSKSKNNWINVDILNADINHDLSKGIPLKNDLVDKVYSSHLLEHLPYEELLKFLNEIHRILKPGGEFLVCIPNAGLYLKSYFQKKMFITYDEMYSPARVNTGSFIDQINYIAYLKDDHKFMFDDENIINILKMTGFKNVEFRDPNFEIDKVERDFESLYVKCQK